MKRFMGMILLLVCTMTVFAQEPGFHEFEYKGYTDTPFIAGSTFRVHQKDRPQPLRVIPSPITNVPAPSDALVLFNGTSLEEFQSTTWQIKDGILIAGKGSLQTQASFGDCQLHIEWRAPNPPIGKSSNMGNSGVFLMSRYELQIYDSYSSKIYADGSAAAIYGQTPPLVNASLPPGQWQSYDIIFTAPVFNDAKLDKEARITVFHNGILVHNNTQIQGPTGHRNAPPYKVHPPKLPLMLQGHSSPVEFRNMWIRDL